MLPYIEKDSTSYQAKGTLIVEISNELLLL